MIRRADPSRTPLLNAPGKLSTWFPGEELLHRALAPLNILKQPLQTLIERISSSEMHLLLPEIDFLKNLHFLTQFLMPT